MDFTAKKTIKMTIVGGAVAATAFLSACGGNNVAENGSPVKNAAETAAVARTPDGGGQGAAETTSGGDVNCSKHGGPVGAPGRPKLDLIAVEATDGTKPGCTEAFTVITEYFQKLPQAEGPGERVLDVQGKWTCARQEDSAGGGQGAVVCGVPNSSLQLETRPSGSTGKAPDQEIRKFPNSARQVRFTGYDADVRMVRFTLDTDQQDGETYRLPLQKAAKVFSAATLCPSDSVTIDDQGYGTLPCGQDQLIQQLTDGNPVRARISVNGADQITTVKESYHP